MNTISNSLTAGRGVPTAPHSDQTTNGGLRTVRPTSRGSRGLPRRSRAQAGHETLIALLLLLLLSPLPRLAAAGPPTGSSSYSGYSGNNPLNPNDEVEPECIDDGSEENSGCMNCATTHGPQFENSGPAANPNVTTYGNPARGMPRWRVSEPILNVLLEDRPFYYRPSRGPEVAFDLWFKNMLGTNGGVDNGNTKFFTVGTNWHTPWRAYVVPDPGVSTNALVFRGDGSARAYSLDIVDYSTRMKLEWASPGYTLTASSGERWVFNVAIVDGSTTNWFLSSHSDPQGHALTFAYDWDIPLTFVNLLEVHDTDGGVTTLGYTNSGPYPGLIASVTGPDGRSTHLTYDGDGRLTNITDMAGLATGIRYDSTNNLRHLDTPYGTTTFSVWSTGTNWAALRIAEMGIRTNFWLYLDEDTGARMSTNFSGYAPTLAGGLTDTFDTVESHKRNSFRWSQRQIELLSANFRTNLLNESFNPDNVTSNDFKLARQRHWLRRVPDTVVSRTLSFERAVSPDGVADGQITWHDYEGKPSGTNWMEGTMRVPRSSAWKLPDASSRYSYFNRNSLGFATNHFETFADGVRSNRLEYAANGIDLTRQIRYVGATEKMISSNVFNAAHLVRSNWNALEELTVFTYEGSNRLTSILRPSGLFTTNFYGSDGRLASTVDQDGSGGSAFRTNAYTWTNGLVLTHTDPRGAVTTNTYDALGRLTQVHDALGVVALTYHKLDLIKTVDRMGFTRSNLFDSLRRVVRTADARNNTTSYRYCSCGSLDYATNALGQVTAFAYDKAGRLTTTFHPDGYNVTNTWNALGELVRVCDNGGACLTNTYNQQGLLASADTAGGRLFTRTYDREDELVSATDANGVTVTNLFDALGRVVVRGLQATNSLEGFAWNARGLLRHTNQLGHVTTNGFDALGRRIGETNANGEAVRFAYAPGGELLTLTDGKDQVTTWKHDLFGRVTNKADNLGTNVFVYRYDLNSRLTYRWTPAKGDTGYTNDANGNVTLVNYSNSTDIVMSYDALNRLTNMVDAVGATRYTYNTAGLLASEDGPWDSDTVSYTYNTGRRRSQMSLLQPNAAAWTQTYAYDLSRRLTNTTSPAGAFGYNYAAVPGSPWPSPARLIQKLTLPSGAYITNGYDTVARLINTVLKDSGHSPLNAHGYEVNAGHQRTKQTRTDGDFADYGYDPIGQLKTALGKESGGTTNRLHEQFGYAYDAAGNLNNRTNNALVQTFNVNSLNELTTVSRGTNFTLAGFTTMAASSVTVNTATATRYADNTFAKDNLALVDGNNTFTAIATDSNGRVDTNAHTLSLPATVTFASDLNGNLTTNGTQVLEFDDENQLSRITEVGVFKSEFTYDGKLRRRIRKEYEWRNSAWVKTNEVRYLYDGSLVLQDRNEFNLAIKTFTRGLDLSGSLQGAGGIGGLLSFSEHTLASTFHIDFHADGNGNITCLLDRNQEVQGRYLFDPFGNTLAASGAMADLNLYRFSSKELHAQSGLVYYLYRYYAPKLQRWLNPDPLAENGGINLFAYAINAPINWIDPFGLSASPPPIPVPGGGPDNGWKWVTGPGLRGGSWTPIKPVPGQSQPSASWDPLGHWDVYDGLGGKCRYTMWGIPITPGQAHNPPPGVRNPMAPPLRTPNPPAKSPSRPPTKLPIRTLTPSFPDLDPYQFLHPKTGTPVA